MFNVFLLWVFLSFDTRTLCFCLITLFLCLTPGVSCVSGQRYGFATFLSRESAERCAETLHGATVEMQTLKVREVSIDIMAFKILIHKM